MAMSPGAHGAIILHKSMGPWAHRFMQDDGPSMGPIGPMGPMGLLNLALYLGPWRFIWPIILTGRDDYMAMSG